MSADTSYRLVVLTLVAALVIGVGVPAAAAFPAGPAGPSAAKQHKKKRKAIKCREGQVPIVVNRRTMACRSLAAALQPPREGDPRLLLAKSVLDDDLDGLRDRRGRRARSLRKLFRKAGRRAYGRVQRAIPQGLARLDQLATTPPKAVRTASPARQLANCAGGPPPTRTDTYSSGSGGQRMTATVTLGAVGTFDLRLEGGAYKISVRITSDECSHFDAPACPTAAGILDATDRSTYKVSLTVAKDDTVLMSRSFDFSGRTRMHAEVDQDAKLDLIDIDDTQTANIELGGARQEFGPVNLIYTGIHHTRVDMPSRNYVPDQGAVDISLTARGVTVGRSDLGKVGNDIAKDLDKSFAALVDSEIENYRRLEAAWQTPNACATLAFDPASDALEPLSKGQTGQLTGHVVARSDGGTASSGKWILVGAGNGTITPVEAAGAAPVFSWTVTNADDGIKLSGEFKATSTAGVASGAWTQPTKPSDNVVRIAGTFTGSIDWDGGGDGRERWSWSGGATFGPRNTDQPGASGHYPLAGGSATYAMTFTANGPGRFGGCSAQGSATKQLAEPDFYGGWLVLGTGDDGLSPPYEYSADIFGYGQMAVTLSACPDPDDNGTTAYTNFLPDPLSIGEDHNSPATSPDGLTYTGTYSTDPATGGIPIVWHWDFHGETM